MKRMTDEEFARWMAEKVAWHYRVPVAPVSVTMDFPCDSIPISAAKSPIYAYDSPQFLNFRFRVSPSKTRQGKT